MSGKRLSSALFSFLLTLSMLPPSVVLADEQQAGAAAPRERDPVAIYVTAGANHEQAQQIRELGKEFEDSLKVRWQLMSNLQKQMRDLSLQPDPDEKTVVAKQEEINKVGAEMASSRIQLMLKIRSILNAEQKQKLVELMQPRTQAKAGSANGAGGAGAPSAGAPSAPSGAPVSAKE